MALCMHEVHIPVELTGCRYISWGGVAADILEHIAGRYAQGEVEVSTTTRRISEQSEMGDVY